MFIKINTIPNKRPFYLNTTKILWIWKIQHPTDNVTRIQLADDEFFDVYETPEEILKLIKGTYLNV